MTYVYKLIDNDTEEIVHVGTSKNLDLRLYKHTRLKPRGGVGKFYRRNCRIEKLESCETVKEAFWKQCEYQKQFNLATDRDKIWNNEEFRNKMKDVAKRSGKISVQIEHTCPYCGKTGRGPKMFHWHFDKCRTKH